MKIIKSIFVLFSVCVLATLATNSYFSDEKMVENNVFGTGYWIKPKIVINEVYYDVGLGKGMEPNDEWIELYNNEDYAVSLKNWTIMDNNTIRIIHADKSIQGLCFNF